MNYKEKVIELFKNLPILKADLERKLFGMQIRYRVSQGCTRISQLISKNLKINEYLVRHEYNYFHPRRITEEQIIDFMPIIEERHLRIYCCEFLKINLQIRSSGIIELGQGVHLQLDNSKDFYDQSEDFFQELFIFLTKKQGMN